MRRTLVAFHAHPDDEAISTGGSLARAAAEGHRVVVVFATRGELGEVPDGLLAPGESLAQRRTREAEEAGAILGVSRIAYLGFHDSGMAGAPHNGAPGAFASAPVDAAAARLAALLDEEAADVLTVYDRHGGYGHPDHIQVHRVGHRAAARAARPPRVYEATVNRDHIRRLVELVRDPDGPLGAELAGELSEVSEFSADEPPDTSALGVPEAEITTTVDVSAYLEHKRAALFAHASQVAETHFFRVLPPEAFAMAFGQEWFIRADARDARGETSLLAGLD